MSTERAPTPEELAAAAAEGRRLGELMMRQRAERELSQRSETHPDGPRAQRRRELHGQRGRMPGRRA